MAANVESVNPGKGNPWRLWVWGAAACLLALPLVAMQFTREVNWTGADFLVFAIMLGAACTIYELGAKMSSNSAYRAATAIAAVAGFVIVWVNIAVGVIGDEGDPANLMFAGVLLVGIVGALMGRLRAHGMARALLATAIAQAAVGVLIYARGMGSGAALFCAAFSLVWLASAGLFHKAALAQRA